MALNTSGWSEAEIEAERRWQDVVKHSVRKPADSIAVGDALVERDGAMFLVLEVMRHGDDITITLDTSDYTGPAPKWATFRAHQLVRVLKAGS